MSYYLQSWQMDFADTEARPAAEAAQERSSSLAGWVWRCSEFVLWREKKRNI